MEVTTGSDRYLELITENVRPHSSNSTENETKLNARLALRQRAD